MRGRGNRKAGTDCKKKLINVGERQMTTGVPTTDRKGFVSLFVCRREILANFLARVLEPFKKREILRRTQRM